MSNNSSFFNERRRGSRFREATGCCKMDRTTKRVSDVTRRTRYDYNATELENCKNDLIQCCLTHMQDSYRVHLNRLRGLKILEMMMARTDPENVPPSMLVHMIWACLSCYHHFLLRIQHNCGPIRWMRRREARKALNTFERLLRFVTSQQYTVAIHAVTSFYEEANLWDAEYFCVSLLKRVLLYSEDFAASILEILTLAENSTLTSPATSRQIVQVLYDLEQSLDWELIDEKLAMRFLEMYYCSLTPEVNQSYNYESIEKGLEMCMRSMTATLDDKMLIQIIKTMLELAVKEQISDQNLLTFGDVLEQVCTHYHNKLRRRAMPEKVFPMVLKLLASDNLLYSLLGNRVLQHLIDRNDNRLRFTSPRIFFADADYNVVLNKYTVEDKDFFRDLRARLHSTILSAIIKHGHQKVYLETTYVSIALFLVEIPCSYTAAAGVCLAMAIQKSALEDTNIEMVHAHRLHATVLSIMSLVCYIHKAVVFYEYISTIIYRRAQFAPHLDPPLKTHYKYAQHYVLWNKPELFFEDWEARYGLWKCFKSKHTTMFNFFNE